MAVTGDPRWFMITFLRFSRTKPRYHPMNNYTFHIAYPHYIYIYPSGADVRPKFHWGFSYVVICSGYISDCFRVCLGLVLIFFRVCLFFSLFRVVVVFAHGCFRVYLGLFIVDLGRFRVCLGFIFVLYIYM